MKLRSIGRKFDIISSMGVLHHLAEPIAGLRELLSLLRPGGFMRIGLYSESARQEVVASQAVHHGTRLCPEPQTTFADAVRT